MDPNAAAAELEQILNNPAVIDDTRAAELRRALLEWQERGGFAPQWVNYPRARQYVRGLTVAGLAPRYQWQTLHRAEAHVALRIPRHMARPISGGCQCRYCTTHPNEAPAWDTLIVPLTPGRYAAEIHAPEWQVEPLEPVAGTDPRD